MSYENGPQSLVLWYLCLCQRLARPPFYVANGEISHTLAPVTPPPPVFCNEFLPDFIWRGGMLVI